MRKNSKKKYWIRIPEITVRYRSPYFGHIFNGGYSAGYYAYTWAEVLDADAFAAFKETGDIFNPEKAKAFRENILSRGGSDDPMKLYKQFRSSADSFLKDSDRNQADLPYFISSIAFVIALNTSSTGQFPSTSICTPFFL